MQLNGSVALITGASRGLGYEVAELFAKRGALLAITARNAQELKAAANRLRAYTDIVAVPGDLDDTSHIEQLVTECQGAFGPIDVLINNASELGPSPMPALARLPIDAFHRILNVNVIAPLNLTQLVLPSMLARHNGTIINVTSDAGVQPYAGWGGYGSSKAALEHWSRILAAEVQNSGIRVYVVDPGDMNTRMHAAAEPGVDLSHLPDPRVVAPAFLRIVESETAPFERFEAQKLAEELALAS